MTRPGRLGALLRLLLALAVGTVAALGAVAAGAGGLPATGNPPGDRVLEAVAGLRDDRVHVTEDGRAMLDERGERAVAAAIAESGLPVHVVVWRPSWFAGYDHDIEAAEQVLAELDEPAVVVLWQGPDASTTQVTEGWHVGYGEDGTVETEPSYLGEAALRLPEWIAQLPAEPLERLAGEEDDGGTAGQVGAGALLGLGATGLVALLLRRVGRPPRRRST